MESARSRLPRLLGRPARIARSAWTTDRWGRLCSGVCVSLFLAVGGLRPALWDIPWAALAAGTGLILALTSLVGWCPFHELFRWLGARDREEVFAENVRRKLGLQKQTPSALDRVLETSPIHESAEAQEYERMINRYAWLLNKPFVKLALHRNRDLKHARVVDIGTGPGFVPVALAKQRPDWEIWALDVSEDMLEKGRKLAKAEGVAKRIHFIKGDATDLPFEPGFFDLALSHFMVHHLPCPADLFREVSRVLKPGRGRALIKDLRRQPRWKTALLLAFSKYVLRYNPLQLKMYRESIDAALTPAEMKGALLRAEIARPEVSGFRGLDLIVAFEGTGTGSGWAHAPVRGKLRVSSTATATASRAGARAYP